MAPDGSSVDDYSPEMTDRLLGVAADVLRSFGSAFGGRHLAIIGGLVPTLMVPEPPDHVELHTGTSDLDFHLSLQLLDGETSDYYDSILEGLKKLGLAPALVDGQKRKWRWVGTHREVQMIVEFLCPAREGARGGSRQAPLDDTVAVYNVGESAEIEALVLGFGHLVPLDTEMIPRRVNADSGDLTYDFPVAGLVPWLCLKADAIQLRNKAKDSYDVVWLLKALGVHGATEAIERSPIWGGESASIARQQLSRLIRDQFLDVASTGPRSYASFLAVGEDDPDPLHAREAVGALGALADELVGRGLID